MDVPAPYALSGSEQDRDNRNALNGFLATVERRAFIMAKVALGNNEDALDVVQDAMMTLARKYAYKPQDEWAPLFYRIVQNRINDYHRQRSVRNRYTGWLTSWRQGTEENEQDPFEQVADRVFNNPEIELQQLQSMERLSELLETLPPRQREAFQYRCWEGLSTAETAQVMKCSEGSVKTHYFRALSTLKAELESYRDNTI